MQFRILFATILISLLQVCNAQQLVHSEVESPSILGLTSEENSADWLGCCRNPYAETLNIEGLAEGVLSSCVCLEFTNQK